MGNQVSPAVRGQWPVCTSFSMVHPIDLQEVKRAGLEGIELTWQSLDMFDPEIKKRADEVVKEAAELKLAVRSVHIPFGTSWDPSSADEAVRTHVLSSVRGLCRLAQEWGVRTAVFHPSWEPIAPEERTVRLDTCRSTLAKLAEVTADFGVRLAVECLPRTCLGHSADEMEYLLSAHPDLGVCCDVNHLFKELPEQFIERLGPRIITTHMSDNGGIDENHWMPGEGVIHWKEVIRSLEAVGYRGPFMYEVRKPNPANLRENWEWLRSL